MTTADGTSVDGSPADGAPVEIGLDGAGGTAWPAAAERMTALLDARPGARLVICDVAALARPRPADLDGLARLRLAAQRRGCVLVLRNTGVGLRLLLELTGLGELFEASERPEATEDPGSP